MRCPLSLSLSRPLFPDVSLLDNAIPKEQSVPHSHSRVSILPRDGESRSQRRSHNHVTDRGVKDGSLPAMRRRASRRLGVPAAAAGHRRARGLGARRRGFGACRGEWPISAA